MYRYERHANRREALHAAVAVSHGRPNITDTDQVMEIAEEFFQWIVKPEPGYIFTPLEPEDRDNA